MIPQEAGDQLKRYTIIIFKNCGRYNSWQETCLKQHIFAKEKYILSALIGCFRMSNETQALR